MSWSRTLKIRQLLRAQLEAGETISLLFSDLRGFSAFTATRGDQAAFKLSQVHEETLRARIDEHGIVVKSFGDGVMAAFAHPIEAIRAAVGIQQAARERNRMDADEPIDVGIGIASGTPVMTDVDFIGHSVNLSQRLSALAKGGQILVSEQARRDANLPPELGFLSLGPRKLRGVGTEQVAEVTWLREVARISDAQDRLTFILTEGASLMVERAKDPKRGIREALAELRGASRQEDGVFSAMLQRAAARLARLALPEPVGGADIGRELPLHQVRLSYRRGRLFLKTAKGEIGLYGVPRVDGERFVAEADRLARGGDT